MNTFKKQRLNLVPAGSLNTDQFYSFSKMQKTNENKPSSVCESKTVLGVNSDVLTADTHPVKQRHGVKQKRKHERCGPQEFTPLWELLLQEPAETKVAADTGKRQTYIGNSLLVCYHLIVSYWCYISITVKLLHKRFNRPSPRVAGQTGAE